jgi:hypothetical protein
MQLRKKLRVVFTIFGLEVFQVLPNLDLNELFG